MKKFTTLTLIAAASALALSATAASAQPYGYDRGDRAYSHGDRGGASINQRLDQIDRRIDRGVQRGDLTGREADSARNQFRQIEHRQEMYRPGGYNRWERADLDRRLDILERQVRLDRHDNQYGYGYGYDYDNRR